MKKRVFCYFLLCLIMFVGCSPKPNKYAGEYEVQYVEFKDPLTKKNLQINLASDDVKHYFASKIIIAEDGTCRVVNTVNKGLYIRIDNFRRNPWTGGFETREIPETNYLPIDEESHVAVQIGDGIYQDVDILPNTNIGYCEETNMGIMFYPSKEAREWDVVIANSLGPELKTIRFDRSSDKKVYQLNKIK